MEWLTVSRRELGILGHTLPTGLPGDSEMAMPSERPVFKSGEVTSPEGPFG